jgi:hypothetical protein
MQARSGCLRLLHRGKRYVFERSPIKSRLEPSSTDAFIWSSFGAVKLRINYNSLNNRKKKKKFIKRKTYSNSTSTTFHNRWTINN